jgi:hypothetical protein
MLPTLTWLIAWLPGLASAFKAGGTLNCLQGFLLWLPPAAVVVIAALSSFRWGATARCGLAVVALGILIGRIVSRPVGLWQPLAAAATVAGLAFVLVQLLPREQDFAPSLQQTESAPIPVPIESQPRSSSIPAATEPSPIPSAAKALARPEQVVVPDRAPVSGAVPEPSAAPASPVTSDSQTAATADTTPAGEVGADRREAMSPAMAGRNASAAAVVLSAPEKGLGVAGPLDVAAWSAKIVALHANGDVTAAADVLRAFRTADPGADAHLPDSLRDWARSVRRRRQSDGVPSSSVRHPSTMITSAGPSERWSSPTHHSPPATVPHSASAPMAT